MPAHHPRRRWTNPIVLLCIVPFARTTPNSTRSDLRSYLSPRALALAWDPSMAPLPFEPGSAVSASPGATENCRRVKYSAGAGAEPLPFCVNGALSFDLVSEHVTKHGRWPDCDLLPAQVRPCQTRTHTPAVRTPTRPRAHTPARPQVHPDSVAPLFFDVGANIGSCTVEMLAR